MSQDLVTLTIDDEGIATVQLRDSDNKNTFTDPLVEQLLARLVEVERDPRSRVCLLMGLPEVFCAGAHQDLLLALADGEFAATDIVLSRALLDLPLPAIAAMEGHAVGGGLIFGLCCDVVLMARESRYGCSFMNMGFTPGMGTTRLLQDAVGPYVAAEMMFGGQLFKGSHFEGRGGVNYVLPQQRVLPKALQLARRMADKPRHALELLKRHLSIPRLQTFEEARTAESRMHQICFSHPETRQIIEENYAGGAGSDKDTSG